MKHATLLCAAALLAASAARAEFALEVDNPRFRVLVPNLPPVKMEPHPSHKEHPNLRLIGVDGPWLVTLNTPDADAGMKPQECANVIATAIPKRSGGLSQEHIRKARLDPNTFIAAYVLPRKAGQMQLNAHLISAAGGAHCVELHVAMVTASKQAAEEWMKTFAGARIEPK